MPRQPSMSELRAFECVARHRSFTRAAAELHLTQSAVSRQVAALEEAVGARLVLRRGNGLELSDAGRDYLGGVRDALDCLDEAAARVRGRRRDGVPVNVASAPTFATQWLLPRLERFRQAHPGVVLNFLPYTPQFDFSAPGDLDVAIQFGEGRFPHAEAHYLLGRDIVPICAPALAGTFVAPADLARHALLQHVEVPRAWRDWFEALGTNVADPDAGPRFCQYALIVKAVASNLGLGLLPRCLIEEPLARGEVALALDVPARGRHGHWLCVPREKERGGAVDAFRGWLAREAIAGEAAAP
jgi:LysR family glycine cleavage system transcriptional activator